MTEHVIKLLPPSPVTSQVNVDIRLGNVPNATAVTVSIRKARGELVSLYSGASKSPDDEPRVIPCNTNTLCGNNLIQADFYDETGKLLETATQQLKVYDSAVRSTGAIEGAWCNFYHWSEEEGRHWNPEIKRYTDNDWHELVQGMHSLGMNIIVLQELFRNQEYFQQNSIMTNGYQGKAFYDSERFPGRMDIACTDPVEAMFDAADQLDMQVLPGIGLYAWFDYTPASLEWHKEIAEEVFRRYGHHPSFYGWYISEEVFGNLNYGKRTAQDIRDFFREFRHCKNQWAPAMPVMLAPNCFALNKTPDDWELLAKELDIICPFGFNRMSKEDLSPQQAMQLLQRIADRNHAHLWLDMEAFDFAEDKSLIPRDFVSLLHELNEANCFEKILCYQYPGMFNAPHARRHLGGTAAMKLYQTYLQWHNRHLDGQNDMVH